MACTENEPVKRKFHVTSSRYCCRYDYHRGPLLRCVCSGAANPWCQLCERLLNLADADTACQEILQMFYWLQDDDDAWTAEVGIDGVAVLFLVV